MTTVTVPQIPAEDYTISIDSHVIDDAHSDLELYTQLLRNELQDDFRENCRTHRLTEKQKQLLPLLAQMITAHSTYMLTEIVDFMDK